MGCAGFILTGGKSSRMGTDKALLVYSGRTLLHRTIGAVSDVASRVALIGNPALYGHFGCPVIPDRFPESGPLAGIEAALSATSADWNIIVACDMPELEADFLAQLCDAAERLTDGTDCLVPKTPDGRIHPLCAIYNRRCLEPARTALLGGDRRVIGVVESLRVHYLPAPFLQNVNTPLEWSTFLESQPA